MRVTWHNLKSAVENLPIFRELFLARTESRKGAAKELSAATFLSLLPIWLYPLLMSFTDQSVGEAVWSCVERGELYLYSAALMGPLIYSVSKRYDANGDEVAGASESERGGFPKTLSLQFPYRGLFSFIAIMVCILAASVFALLRASADGLFAPDLNEETVIGWSVFMYVLTLACMFCVLVYRLDLEQTSNRFGDDEEELSAQWRKHK